MANRARAPCHPGHNVLVTLVANNLATMPLGSMGRAIRDLTPRRRNQVMQLVGIGQGARQQQPQQQVQNLQNNQQAAARGATPQSLPPTPRQVATALNTTSAAVNTGRAALSKGARKVRPVLCQGGNAAGSASSPSPLLSSSDDDAETLSFGVLQNLDQDEDETRAVDNLMQAECTTYEQPGQFEKLSTTASAPKTPTLKMKKSAKQAKKTSKKH